MMRPLEVVCLVLLSPCVMSCFEKPVTTCVDLQLSHQTHHHIPKQQSNKAEGEVGGGFENIGFSDQKKKLKNKQNIINKTLEIA